jgi:hypothetical protein
MADSTKQKEEICKALDLLGEELSFLKTSISCFELVFSKINNNSIKYYEHLLFFIGINFFSSICLSIKKFIDKDKRSHSFYWILNKANTNNIIDQKTIDNIKILLENLEKKYDLFIALRDKIVAHPEKGSVLKIFNRLLSFSQKNMIIFPEFKDLVRDIEKIKQEIEKQLYINTVSFELSNTSISLEVKIDPDKTSIPTYIQEIAYVREELEKLLEKLEKEEKIDTRVRKEIIF